MIELPTNPNYSKNVRKCGNNGIPCAICGKPIAFDKIRHMVHIHNGGEDVVTEEEAQLLDPAADLGMYPVGAACLKLYPELKPYIHKIEGGLAW